MYETIENMFSNKWSWSDWSDNELSVSEWFIITFVGLSLIAIGIEIYMKMKKGGE